MRSSSWGGQTQEVTVTEAPPGLQTDNAGIIMVNPPMDSVSDTTILTGNYGDEVKNRRANFNLATDEGTGGPKREGYCHSM